MEGLRTDELECLVAAQFRACVYGLEVDLVALRAREVVDRVAAKAADSAVLYGFEYE
jgi:hypothetical protein